MNFVLPFGTIFYLTFLQGADAISTGRILEAVVQICFETQQWDLLNENIIALSKRRSQLKAAVTKMVQQCCTYVDQMPNKDLKLKLIDTLRTVTTGKVNSGLSI